jgi:hypothetical protein
VGGVSAAAFRATSADGAMQLAGRDHPCLPYSPQHEYGNKGDESCSLTGAPGDDFRVFYQGFVQTSE